MVVHLDIVNETAVLTCFWNRRSIMFYDEVKSFRFPVNGFQEAFENEIRPFFGL